MADDSVENHDRARKIAYLRAYRVYNGERINKEKRDRYATDAAYRAEKLTIANNYYKENRDEVVRKRNARYAADPTSQKAASSLQRAKKLSAEGTHGAQDIDRIRKSQKDRCGFCRRKLIGKGHIDHITALTKGGSNWPNNLQILCASCNTSKSNRDQVDFARSRGLLL